MCWIVWVSILNWHSEYKPERATNCNIWEIIFELIDWNKNRWQEGYGISTYNWKEIHTSKFNKVHDPETISRIEKQKAEIKSIIWHARYPTSWKNNWSESLQPFNHIEKLAWKGFSFAFNWNIANAPELSDSLEKFWYELKMNWLDTEVLKFLIIKEIDNWNNNLTKIIENVLKQIDWACNIAIIKDNWDLAIAKDRNGFHPLSWAEKDWLFLFSSEAWALYNSWYDKVNHVKSWEIIKIENWEINIQNLDIETNNTPCVFELIYFSSPESTIHWIPVSRIRSNLWRQLAIEMWEKIDKQKWIIVDVPSSSYYQARWFANKSGIKNINWITKNPHIDRSFIANADSIEDVIRHKYVFNPNMKEHIEWKIVYLTDDSMVRGNTMKYLVKVFKGFL